MGSRTIRSTEIRVGLFIMAALGVLTAFILILANFQFTEGFIVHVDFQSSMTAREGALVRISGMKAGKVKRIEYRGPDEADPSGDSERPYLVRISLELDREMATTIRRDTSRFLLTTKGVLGETYVEIHPGHDDGPLIEEGDIVRGVQMTSPEQVMTDMSALLGKVSGVMEDQEHSIEGLIESLDELAAHSRGLAKTIEERAPSLLDEVDGAVQDVRTLAQRTDAVVARVQDVIGDGEALHRIMGDAEILTSVMAAGAPDILLSVDSLVEEGQVLVVDARTTLEQLEGRVDGLADGAEGALREARGALRDSRGLIKQARPAMERLPAVLDSVETLLAGLVETLPALRTTLDAIPAVLTGARRVTDAMAKGEGTLGALVMDRALYDDLREMLLDLKRRPWKVIWKE